RLPTTMFLTLLTALTGVLAQRTATGDVAVASMVAGRSRPEHRRLVGMVANPVVVRTAVPAGGTFAQMLDRVRAGVVAAGTRQDAPWPLVARRAGVGAAEIWLNMAPPPELARFPGVAVDTDVLPRDVEIDVPAAAWRGEMLVCTVVDSGPGTDVLATIDYNARQLTATTVAGLAVDIADLLAAAAARQPPTADVLTGSASRPGAGREPVRNGPRGRPGARPGAGREAGSSRRVGDGGIM